MANGSPGPGTEGISAPQMLRDRPGQGGFSGRLLHEVGGSQLRVPSAQKRPQEKRKCCIVGSPVNTIPQEQPSMGSKATVFSGINHCFSKSQMCEYQVFAQAELENSTDVSRISKGRSLPESIPDTLRLFIKMAL